MITAIPHEKKILVVALAYLYLKQTIRANEVGTYLPKNYARTVTLRKKL